MKDFYTINELKEILAQDDTTAADILNPHFEAIEGGSPDEGLMNLTIKLDGAAEISVSWPQLYEADTEEFYDHWKKIIPDMLAEAREKLAKIVEEQD